MKLCMLGVAVGMLQLQFLCATKLRAVPQLPVATGTRADLCLRRVASLPRSQGYGALCESLAVLSRQQKSSSTAFISLKEENENLQTVAVELESARKAAAAEQTQNESLQKQVAEQSAIIAQYQDKEQRAKAEHQALLQEKSHSLRQRSKEHSEEQRAAMGMKHLATELAEAQKSLAHLQAVVHIKGLDLQNARSQLTVESEEKERIAKLAQQSADALTAAKAAHKMDLSTLIQQVEALQHENALLTQRCG